MADLSNIKVHLVETWDEAQAFMSWLGERRPVLGFDLETEGIDWWRHKIRTSQFGDAMTAWTIPHGRWSGLVEHVFKNYEGDLVAHNGFFDAKFIELDNIEIDYKRYHDTYIQAHLRNPRQHGGLGLKNLANRHISSLASTGDKLLKQYMKATGTDWDTVPIDEPAYWAYGALDVIFTARLHEKFAPSMAAMQEIYDLERRVGLVLMRMTMTGIEVDLDYVAGQKIQMIQEIMAIENAAKADYGIEKIGSNTKVAEVLMTDGWVPTVRTETGKASMTEAVLQEVDHPLAKMKVEHGKLRKLVGTYLENFEKLVTEDGRIHCDIKQLGAATGRMSVARPSLQNLPAPRDGDETSARIRNCFVASEGQSLCAIDYDQIELRIAADHSDSTALIEAFRTEPDMHSFMAAMMYGVSVSEVSKAQRQTSKAITFGKLFGAGVKKIGQQLGVTTRAAAAFLEQYDKAFPELKAYMNHVADEGARLGREHSTSPYVYTEYGRYQPTPPRTEYRLTNYRTQGTAADLLKMAIVELDAAGFGPHMLLPIHDEICFSFPSEYAEDMMAMAIEVMEFPDRRVPLTAGGSIGQRLGECK